MPRYKTTRKVCDWGINDVDYVTQIWETSCDEANSKRLVWCCPYYTDWVSMIKRCLSAKYLQKHPTYKGCTICEDWKYLSNFIKWVDSQPNRDWENCSLDKDLITNGIKIYSPENCLYINRVVNTFISTANKYRGRYMLGVTLDKRKTTKTFVAQCNNPFVKTCGHIGYYATEIEAHKAWQAKKHEYACALADIQDDPRVADALHQRYAPDKDWTNK